MKSSTKNIVIVASAAVILGGAIFALTRPGVGKTASSSAAPSSASDIKLISKSSENVASMKVTNKKGSFTLVPQAGNSASSASDSSAASSAAAVNYTVQELSGCPVNTSETNLVVQNGFSLTATKDIGTVSNKADYGLADPLATVEVTFKDGSTFGYKIGNATATDASAYYMCGTKSDSVYVVNVDEGIFEDVNYFVTKQMLSITNTSASSAANADSNGNVFTKITLSGKNFPKAVTFQNKGAKGSLTITAPDAYDADTSKLTTLQTCLTSLAAESVAAIKPDASTLEKYGFNEPTVIAEYVVNGKSYKLIIGAQTGSSYYAIVDGANVVYKVTAENIAGLVSQDMFSLRSKLIHLVNIETVEHLTVTANGTTNEMNVTRTENAASSTQDKKAYDYKITGNGGKALDYDTNYRNLYQKIIGLQLSGDTDQKQSGTAAVTIEYKYFGNTTADKIELYPMDSRRYTVVYNNKVYGLCAKTDVDSILQAVTDFEAGKKVSEN